MSDADAVILNPAHWADRPTDLARVLAVGRSRRVSDPTGVDAGANGHMTIHDVSFWSNHGPELASALRRATGGAELAVAGGVGAAPAAGERLTLTVEEAATLLGISRAFAYEAVNRGEIPSIRIGRRILVPRSLLMALVEGDQKATD